MLKEAFGTERAGLDAFLSLFVVECPFGADLTDSLLDAVLVLPFGADIAGGLACFWLECTALAWTTMCFAGLIVICTDGTGRTRGFPSEAIVRP